MSRKIISIFISIPLLLAVVVVGVINVRLYDHRAGIRQGTKNTEIVRELAALAEAIHGDDATEMQNVYPEGYVFMNALYGLSWCNVLLNSRDTSVWRQGYQEVALSLRNIDSAEGRGNFESDLPIKYGAFYAGWRNYLAGRKLIIDPIRDSVEVSVFQENCRNIAESLKSDVYPVSYYNGAWPADVFVCIATLATHDRIFPPQYGTLIDQWIQQVRASLDEKGLIPHAVHYATNEIVESARGSSMSLILVFLPEIDDRMAVEQFELYQKHFVDTVVGLTGIREYPKSDSGPGDIDSGPVVCDIGPAATIVGMPAAFRSGNNTLSAAIQGEIEAFGFPFGQEKKVYLFGQLPIADAFITWCHSMIQSDRSYGIFLVFHILSSGVAAILVLLLWLTWRDKRRPGLTMFIPWGPD